MRDRICFVTLFILNLFLGWLLALAYPDGITTAETRTYYTTAFNFQWFGQNPCDWIRTVPYGALLLACFKLDHPTRAIYWLNTLIFSFNSALVFVLMRLVFSSRRLGFTLAIAALLFEFASMRMYFTHLHATADPLFGELVYAGVLLALIGALGRRSFWFVLGYAIFGFAAFLKPSGVSIFPAWICFAIWAYCARTEPSNNKRLLALVASIALMLAPAVLWTVRNYYVYGYAKYMGIGGCALLMSALPLMSDSDHVLDNPARNAEFIAIVRHCEDINLTSRHLDRNSSCPSWIPRMIRYDTYMYAGPSITGPFDFLANNPHPSDEERNHKVLYSGRMFGIDQKSAQLAMRILAHHPIEYLGQVWVHYCCMFTPGELPPAQYECFQERPGTAYKEFPQWWVNTDPRMYPGLGHPDATISNLAVAGALGTVCASPFWQSFLGLYFASELWLVHAIAVLAVIAYCCACKNSDKVSDLLVVKRLSIVLIMLFLTTISQYLLVSLVEVPRLRYEIACGELELHLLILIALFSIVWLVCRYGVKCSSLKNS